MNAKEKMIKARINLILEQPFFGALALKLKLVEDMNCKTMWTNGVSIGYNPPYVDSLSVAKTQGGFAHEVLHCANGHIWRRDAREKGKWNRAADYVTNPTVLEAGMSLPDGYLYRDDFVGMSAEYVYGKLEDENQGQDGNKPEDGKGQDDNGCGEVRDTPEAKEEVKAEWHIATIQAAKAAAAMGKLPASLSRLIEEIRHPATDWKSVTRRFVQDTAQDDYSWQMPNPRYVQAGFYLPSMKSEEMRPIVVGWDTSGSLDNRRARARFAGELKSIIQECNPELTVVIYTDAKVQHTDIFEQGEPVEFHPKGGGGTNFCPLFDEIQIKEYQPACVIYLTDGYGTFPADAPEYPVLWAMTTDCVAPFGETVKIEGE